MTSCSEQLAKEYSDPPELVRLENVVKSFHIGQTFFSGRSLAVRAVDGVNLTIHRENPWLGPGNPGVEKLHWAGLYSDLKSSIQEAYGLKVKDISKVSGRDMKQLRRKMQIIFHTAILLNRRRTIKSAIIEPLTIDHIGSRSDRINRVSELMEEVGLRPEFAERYPHEFSGGQRQRIDISRGPCAKSQSDNSRWARFPLLTCRSVLELSKSHGRFAGKV